MIYSMESEGLQIPSAAAGSLANKRSLLRNALFFRPLPANGTFGIEYPFRRRGQPCKQKVITPQ